jgi:hypothetical protein
MGQQQPYQVQVKQEARSEFDEELPMEEQQETMEDASSSEAIKEAAFVHRPPPVCIIPRMPKVRLVFQDIRKKSTKESIKKLMRIATNLGNLIISCKRSLLGFKAPFLMLGIDSNTNPIHFIGIFRL